jgi:hypothetical protein
MEHGANNETQLWSVARVMCGEEFEQVLHCCCSAF